MLEGSLRNPLDNVQLIGCRREREREREREGGRGERERERDRDRETETKTETDRETQADRDRERQIHEVDLFSKLNSREIHSKDPLVKTL